MTTDVSAIGLWSLGLLTVGFLGIGMMVADFRQEGTVACDRDWLNILVRTPESWYAQALSTFPSTPSGPGAFLGFTVASAHLTRCSWMVSGGLVFVEDSRGRVERGLLVSKRAKKLLSSSAEEASALVDTGELLLKLVSWCSACHTRSELLCER